MSDGFNETPVRGKHLHNTAPAGETAVAVLPAIAGNGDPVYNEGNAVALSADLAGNLRVVIGGSEGGVASAVDVTDRAGRLIGVASLDSATLAALESVDLNVGTRDDLVSRLSAALESVDLNAATRDDLVTRLTAAITDLRDTLSTSLEAVSLNQDTRDDLVSRLSTNLESVDLNVATRDDIVNRLSTSLEDVGLNTATRDDLVGRLSTALESVDLNSGTVTALTTATPYVRGGAVTDANPFPVVLQGNPGTLIDSGLLSSANLAPGASVDLASGAIAGTLGRLAEITAASSVRIRVALLSGTAGSLDPLRVFFVDPTGASLVYQSPERDALTAGTGETFTLRITNMDNLRTADVYGSITHSEA